MISLIFEYFGELQISRWMFWRYGFSRFSSQLCLQNCIQVKFRDKSLYISLNSLGIAAAALILYIFSKKRLNSYFDPFLFSNCLILFSIAVKNGQKLLWKETLMIDLICVGRLIINPLNQLKSPVCHIMSVYSIWAMVYIGLLLVNWCGIASVLFSNAS